MTGSSIVMNRLLISGLLVAMMLPATANAGVAGGQDQKSDGLTRFAMAVPPVKRNGGGKEITAKRGRYIVTHKCALGSAATIVRDLPAGSFRLLDEFEFTPQFLIDASPAALEALSRQPCVVSIQPDSLNAPAGN